MARVRLQGYVGENEYDFFQESYTKFMAERKSGYCWRISYICNKSLNEKKGYK